MHGTARQQPRPQPRPPMHNRIPVLLLCNFSSIQYPVSNGFSCRLANKNGSIPRCSTEVLLQGSPAMQIKDCTTAMRALQDEAGQICPGRDAGGNGWLALLSWRQSGKEEGSGVDANGTCLVTWSDCCVSRYSTVCLICPLENLVLPTPSERSGRESRYSQRLERDFFIKEENKKLPALCTTSSDIHALPVRS